MVVPLAVPDHTFAAMPIAIPEPPPLYPLDVEIATPEFEKAESVPLPLATQMVLAAVTATTVAVELLPLLMPVWPP